MGGERERGTQGERERDSRLQYGMALHLDLNTSHNRQTRDFSGIHRHRQTQQCCEVNSALHCDQLIPGYEATKSTENNPLGGWWVVV